MKEVFREYLFRKHILVSEEQNGAKVTDDCDKLCLLVSLSSKFSIRISEGAELVTEQILLDAAHNLGEYVPEPFYRGFPDSVRTLTSDQKLFDQLLHYSRTYGMGWFQHVGHSALEDIMDRLKFSESTEPKDFRILNEKAAEEEVRKCIQDILRSTRPLNVDDWLIVQEGYVEYGMKILPDWIPCKNTVAKLLCFTKNVPLFAIYLKLPDVIKVLEHIQYEKYGSENLRKLNLKNQDRKLLTKLIDACFDRMPYHGMTEDIDECFEKKAIWKGLLHHIHYNPKLYVAEVFVQMMRRKCNPSAYSEFEKCMQEKTQGNCYNAARVLHDRKGTGAVVRNLNYILSRCSGKEEAEEVIGLLKGTDVDPTILVQMLEQYGGYTESGARTFLFTRNNRMRVHTETTEEVKKRKSFVRLDIREAAAAAIRKQLGERLKETFDGKKVYVSSGMYDIAVPVQTSTGSSGFDVLPTGSRVKIPEGKKIRAFTYWEDVNDIDLSCFGLSEDGDTREFSWRNMYQRANDETGVLFSGDETSGYYGGSEYFDIDIEQFKSAMPGYRYIVFCDNVFSDGGSTHFKDCLVKAGYMMRDNADSGEVFEPKTVKSSFRLTTDSSYSWMFALDLMKREIVWLNVGRKGNHAIAGESGVEMVRKWLNVTDVISMYDIFSMCGGIYERDPAKADIVATTDDSYTARDGQEVIRPCDIEKMQNILSGWT